MRFGARERIAAALAVAVLAGIALLRGVPDEESAAVVGPSADRFGFAAPSIAIAAAEPLALEGPPRFRAAPPPARRASEVEICGVGTMNPESPGVGAYLKRAAADAQATRVRLFETMKSSADEGVRAFGIYLAGGEAASEAAAALRPQAHDCAGDETCLKRVDAAATRAYRNALRPSAEALARAASITRDPMVYAVAMQACQGPEVYGAAQGACQLISAEQWARLDPDNAVAWFHVAAASRARRDPAAEAEALQRVASAGESRRYVELLPDIALALLPGDATPLERHHVAVVLIGIYAAWTGPDYQGLVRYCSDETLRDANRRQSCDAIATALAFRGTTLLDLAIGAKLGERAGWPVGNAAAARLQQDAAKGVQAFLSIPGEEGLSCRSIDDFRTHIRRLAQAGGELGAARAAIEESGRTTAEWAEDYRERLKVEREARADADKAAKASASAASSSS